MCIFCVAFKSQFVLYPPKSLLPSISQVFKNFSFSKNLSSLSLSFSLGNLTMTTTARMNRPILILLLFVSLLLKTSTASAAAVSGEGNMTSRNYGYRTQRFVPRLHLHPYYVTPHRTCDSFTRPYARSMCIELQRIHRSSRKQPIVSPPPPEIDPRYGVDKRLVPSGPNPLHN
ncbi:hypothetical protein CARUB_v10010464mg [Capsella rubella]|uniref:Uncharacterized protein n=1 Tax=Capsella rubella TaxID=81985 RepID=R0GN03_9BRAS|nr:CLAVATA3/ESR (CLE)-related protein 9 [Capsella rubella]EOA37146.1 hypothetical protein CARUB_v10010464mg [Capsella rubella]